jgi:hypothetical protein
MWFKYVIERTLTVNAKSKINLHSQGFSVIRYNLYPIHL